MKICHSCVLPETFPGIRFSGADVCQHCSSLERKQDPDHIKKKYQDKFYTLVGELKSQGPFDVLLAFSGGKDSTYTLSLLKEDMGLRVLAVTFDNGFISEGARKNIREVTQRVKADHMMIAPSFEVLSHAFRMSLQKDLYPLKSLERASAICNTCMYLVKSFMLKTAIQMGVPLIGYGWSPGQAPIQSSVLRLNRTMISDMQKAIAGILGDIMGEAIRAFVMQDRDYAILSSDANARFYNVHPLAFLEYDEGHVFDRIKSLGWEPPGDTDANSTNCLLNALGIDEHLKRFGFHPYAHEIAGLVRSGHLSRKEGLEKLARPVDKNMLTYVRKRLGLDEP